MSQASYIALSVSCMRVLPHTRYTFYVPASHSFMQYASTVKTQTHSEPSLLRETFHREDRSSSSQLIPFLRKKPAH